MKADRRITKSLALIFLCLLVTFAGGATRAAGDDLDLSKAVKIGSGKVMVIEFTDPDCPFCRKAEAYFRGRPDVTRYIFFLPLKSHPASKGKVQYVLSTRDKAAAYLELTPGPLDAKRKAEITAEGVRLQEEHLRIARSNKITATPSFIIYGRVIEGFDQRRLQDAIGR